MGQGAWGATVHGVSRSWTWLSEQHFQRNWGLGVFFDHKAKHREAEIANPVGVQRCQPSRIFIKAHPRPFLHGQTEVGAVPQGTRVFHVFWHLFSLPPKHIFAHLINACLFVFFSRVHSIQSECHYLCKVFTDYLPSLPRKTGKTNEGIG